MKVKLLYDRHEHRGEVQPIGAVIDAPDDLAAWMIENELAEPIPANVTKTNKKGANHGA